MFPTLWMSVLWASETSHAALPPSCPPRTRTQVSALPALPELRKAPCPRLPSGSGQPGRCHVGSSAAPRFGRVGYWASHRHLRQLWRGPEWGPSCRGQTQGEEEAGTEGRWRGMGVMSGSQTNKRWTLCFFFV